MAVYKIFPTQDASIYTEFPNTNTGLDQILEASTYIKNDTAQVSRYLIKFSTSEISDVIENKVGSNTFTTYLKNFNAVVSGLNLTSKLYFYPVSGEWGMGTGRFGDSPIVTNGTSWNWLDYSGSTLWPTSSFPAYVTASYSSSSGGGNWYTGSNLGLDIVVTQSFDYASSKDITVEVKNTVLNWYSHSLDSGNGIENQGFIVKQQDSDEFVDNINNQTTFRYFSIDTNTIYPPQLEFRWDDYSFSTGSSTNTILSTPETFVSIYNNAGVYYSESVPRFRIAAIPKYPDRQFITASYYTTNYFLPESQSLYAIKDTTTNEFVVEFDSDYTRISADATSSYFDVYMNGLEPERYYTVLIKTVIGDVTKVFDENIMFKVSKGWM